MRTSSDLYRVVELNEGAKAILWESRLVDLLALDAVVRSTRAGAALRGFVEVSTQMRRWSRELNELVRTIGDATAAQVEAVSAFVRQDRLAGLLAAAAAGASPRDPIAHAHEQARQNAEAARETLVRLRRKSSSLLQDLQQLGLMSNVLSRTAMIEAASGDELERRDLSAVAAEFGRRSEQVMTILRKMEGRP